MIIQDFLIFPGTVTSPSYPSIYAGSLNEGWFISSSDSTKKIQLTVNVLDTECNCNSCNATCAASCDANCTACPYDYLVCAQL